MQRNQQEQEDNRYVLPTMDANVASSCIPATSIVVHEGGPDYKDQCRGSSNRMSSSSTEASTPSSEVPVRRLDASTNLPSDPTNNIPIVRGFPLPNNVDMLANGSSLSLNSVPRSIHFEWLSQRHRCETDSADMIASPEQAPPTLDSSASRKSPRSSQLSLSQREKRYWIKVIICAVLVNTLLVTAVVVGGVCGTMHCNFSTFLPRTVDIGPPGYVSDVSAGDNKTDAPTPSPSQRRMSSFAPTISFAPSTPSLLDQTLPPTANVSTEVAQPSNPAFGPLLESMAPSASPVSASSSPNMDISGPDDFSSFPEDSSPEMGFPIFIVLPIALVVDLILVTIYLFFHYKRWVKARHTVGDGSMTSVGEMTVCDQRASQAR